MPAKAVPKAGDRQQALLSAIFYLLIFLAPFALGCVNVWGSMTLAALLLFFPVIRPEILKAFFDLPRSFRTAAAGIAVYLAIQSSFSLVPEVSRIELLLWCAFSAAFLFVYSQNCRDQARLLEVLAWSALFQAVWGLLQTGADWEYAGLFKKEAHFGFATGTYLNRNHLAGMLELGLGIQAGLLLGAFKSGRRRFLYGGMLAVTLMAFICSGSRAGFVSLTGAFLLTGAVLNLRLRLFFWGLAGAAILASIFPWAANPAHGRWNLLLRHMVNGEGRFPVWGDTLEIIRDYPLTGTGLGTFRWVLPGYQSGQAVMGWPHAHNDYLELASEVGLPVFALLAVLFGCVLIKALAALRKTPAEFGVLPAGMLTGALAFVFHGAADFNFAVPANLFLWLILLACLSRHLQTIRHPEKM